MDSAWIMDEYGHIWINELMWKNVERNGKFRYTTLRPLWLVIYPYLSMYGWNKVGQCPEA